MSRDVILAPTAPSAPLDTLHVDVAPLEPFEEPLCRDCLAHEGLCPFHAKQILPQLSEPSWPRLIGVSYVCEKPECNDHLVCSMKPMPTPRASCDCHPCRQRRQALRRSVAPVVTTHSVAYVDALERKQAARRPKHARRLLASIGGAFSPSLPRSRSAA